MATEEDHKDPPLASAVLAYDEADPICAEELYDLRSVLPNLAPVATALVALDKTSPSLPSATSRGERLYVAGTYTREAYVGCGISKHLSHWFMHEMDRRGYRLIKTLSLHPAMTTIWGTPPVPFCAIMAATLDPAIARGGNPIIFTMASQHILATPRSQDAILNSLVENVRAYNARLPRRYVGLRECNLDAEMPLLLNPPGAPLACREPPAEFEAIKRGEMQCA
ncbi:hypothetical protein C8A00DRAFT_35727 [Chaetomidium leptoderma]|uniref:Uncharacterized protein n=1 Tax=Chaetomidium leptoderma TaxID=669021 RepID=A0AAN6VHZ7_9PEZI|nr:hypothetical protein C8A00DRAFT_35727 [Chaetomidium leptoderma]